MPAAARPLPLDALRRLIAENDYWNPHSAQHQELQRKVSEGFGRLCPANHPGDRQDHEPESSEAGELEEIRQLQERLDQLLDDKGNIYSQYQYPYPEKIWHALQELEREDREIRDRLNELGNPPSMLRDTIEYKP